MLIRKITAGSGIPDNAVLDGYSTSQTDAYSCNYVNNLINNVWSVTEKWTGGYFADGKKIYCKTNAILNNTNYNGNFYVAHNISDIDKIIDYKMVGFRRDGRFFIAPVLYPNYQFYAFDIDTSNIRIHFDGNLNGNYLIENIYYTLYYTKTTDSGTRGGTKSNDLEVGELKTNESGGNR